MAQAESILTLMAAQRQREDKVMAEILARTVDRSWVDVALKAKGLKL